MVTNALVLGLVVAIGTGPVELLAADGSSPRCSHRAALEGISKLDPYLVTARATSNPQLIDHAYEFPPSSGSSTPVLIINPLVLNQNSPIKPNPMLWDREVLSEEAILRIFGPLAPRFETPIVGRMFNAILEWSSNKKLVFVKKSSAHSNLVIHGHFPEALSDVSGRHVYVASQNGIHKGPYRILEVSNWIGVQYDFTAINLETRKYEQFQANDKNRVVLTFDRYLEYSPARDYSGTDVRIRLARREGVGRVVRSEWQQGKLLNQGGNTLVFQRSSDPEGVEIIPLTENPSSYWVEIQADDHNAP